MLCVVRTDSPVVAKVRPTQNVLEDELCHRIQLKDKLI